MKPIIIKNSRLPKMLSWFMEVGGITLFPFIFIRGEGDERLIRHETIHIKQYAETLVLGFLLIYVWDFLYGFAKYKNYDDAYRSIRFEREAYGNELDIRYLESRRFCAWAKYKV
tara:strand:- start:66 stop:407 length:342 start_codon:yes stop_codon:yes gene_type:complete